MRTKGARGAGTRVRAWGLAAGCGESAQGSHKALGERPGGTSRDSALSEKPEIASANCESRVEFPLFLWLACRKVLSTKKFSSHNRSQRRTTNNASFENEIHRTPILRCVAFMGCSEVMRRKHKGPSTTLKPGATQ